MSTNDSSALAAGCNCLRTWATTLSGEFEELQRDAWRGRRSLMDHYGATNPAEFFAVATESFFERPEAICEGAAHRLRPKFMTVSTTVIGLVPILLATGAGGGSTADCQQNLPSSRYGPGFCRSYAAS